ncbi:MAG: hypothetical protein HY319_26780 [Armatimonadetes bacterium]|nr:hypothetical protein [Armatimonadota bacterium]
MPEPPPRQPPSGGAPAEPLPDQPEPWTAQPDSGLPRAPAGEQHSGELDEMVEELHVAWIPLEGGLRLVFDHPRQAIILEGAGRRLLVATYRELLSLRLKEASIEGDIKSHCSSTLVLLGKSGPLLKVHQAYRVYDEPGPSWEVPRNIEQNCQTLARLLGRPLSQQQTR